MLVGGYLDGKPVSEDDVKKSTITWISDKIRASSPHISGGVSGATIAVDPTTTPRLMDIRYEGGRPTLTGPAICDWLGPDGYRIAIDRRGQGRPVELVSEPGTGHTLHVRQRQT